MPRLPGVNHLARNPPQAHICRAALEAEGIEAVIQGEELFGARGGIPVSEDTAPSVWIVHEKDTAAAAMVVARFR